MIGIRNMDIPKGCNQCLMCLTDDEDEEYCNITNDHTSCLDTERLDTCPLVELKKDGWISCSERLPEEGKQVLVSGYNTYGKEVTIASYQGEQYGWTCGLVSAWQPLPSPYEKEIKTS